MVNIDPIKYAHQSNNYNGAKIVINNPVVNVPCQESHREPEKRIYEYPETPLPAGYSEHFTNPVIIPDGKIVPKEPESVITPVKVEVPKPVYMKQPTPKEEVPQEEAIIQEPVIIEQAPITESEIIPIAETVANNVPEQVETPEVTQAVQEEPIKQEPLKKDIEIIPPSNLEPKVDYTKVCANLESDNYDVQAIQLKEIVDAGAEFEKTKNADVIKPYHVEQIFIDISDIVKKDTSVLAGPTEAQIQIREKFIANTVAAMKQQEANIPQEQWKLPYQLTEQDVNYAQILTDKELAERNKNYAMVALAIMSKTFVDRVENETGTKVPITDVPGMATIVNALKDPNFAIRMGALEALSYMQRAEYARELAPIYEAIIATDNDANVKMAAEMVYKDLNNKINANSTQQAA